MQAAATKLMESLIGIESQTPSSPHHWGKTASRGMRNSICRVTLRKMLLPACPMLWKKLPMTIWAPTNGKAATTEVSQKTCLGNDRHTKPRDRGRHA